MAARLTPFLCVIALVASAFADSRAEVLDRLNATASVDAEQAHTAWRGFFDACLKMTESPRPVGGDFSHETIWPGMDGWQAVSNWASQNEHMEEAIIDAAGQVIIGLPYGADHEDIPDAYRSTDVVAEIGVDGQLHVYHFGYVTQVRRACAWTTAECYRLLEEEQHDRALRLAISEMVVLRKFCDREFLDEKLVFIELLSQSLDTLRDMLFAYGEGIPARRCATLAARDIPFLRVDATRLLMPEGDRVVAEAVLDELFDAASGLADGGQFRDVLTDIQADREPLTRFGAARHWERVADLHGGLEASMERLERIYDDWWRRWRLRPFHPMLEMDSELERSNPVRYAAVILVIRDINALFEQRSILATEINAAAVAAALCGYRNHYGVYPASVKKTYTQFMAKTSNADYFQPLALRTDRDWMLFDTDVGTFHYRRITDRMPIDTPLGRAWIEPGQCVLYSVGGDHEDGGGWRYSGAAPGGDYVMWPPIKMIERNAGLLD